MKDRDSLSTVIEKKRKQCDQILNEKLSNNFLARESFDNLNLVNSELANQLLSSVSIGRDLLDDGVIMSIDEILRLIEVKSVPEMTLAMFESIGKARNNAVIRKTAANIGQMVLKSRAPNSNLSIIQSHYGLQDRLLDKLTAIQKLELMIAKEIAESIYEFVKYRIAYIPERAEYIQPPLLTLKIVKGGDCDDVSVLLCSLWEAIGFETVLHFMPGHVFPGVKLVLPETHDAKARIYNVKADPSMEDLNMFQLSYDLGCGVGPKEEVRQSKLLLKLYGAKSSTVPPVNYPFYCEVLVDE